MPKAGIVELLLWVLCLRKRYRVSGHSMQPLLQPGDTVFMQPLRAGDQLQPGDIVILRLPSDGETIYIKQVHALADDLIEVRGVNPADSRDSRQFGQVPHTAVLGIVTSVA